MSELIELNSEVAKRILACSIKLGKATSALIPFFVHVAISEYRRVLLSKADDKEKAIETLLTDFQSLIAAVRNNNTLSGQQAVLTTKIARKYDLPRLCEAEIQARRMVVSMAGYLDQSVVTAELDLATKKAGAVSSSTVSRAIESFSRLVTSNQQKWKDAAQIIGENLLGTNDVQDPETETSNLLFVQDVPEFNVKQEEMETLRSQLDQAKSAWIKLNTGSSISADDLSAIARQMELAAGDRLRPQLAEAKQVVTNIEKVWSDTAQLKTLLTDFKPETLLTSEGLSNARVGIGAAAGLLAALGAKAESQDLQRAAGYIGAVSQIQQSVAVLMTAGTGWGAAIAICGLASGTGGIGVFGGGAASQAAVLGAIADLKQTMLTEFKKMNTKLAEMAETLGEILNKVNEIKADVRLAIELLRSIDAQSTALLLRQEQRFIEVIAELQEGSALRCGSEASEGSIQPARLLECVGIYARMATAASSQYLIGTDNLSAARMYELVALAFGDSKTLNIANNQDLSAMRDRWSAMALVSRLLADQGLPQLGSATNEPILVAALRNLTGLYEFLDDPATVFGSIKAQGRLHEELALVKYACNQYALFSYSLRGDNGWKIVDGLINLLGSQINKFSAQTQELLDTITKKELDNVQNGRPSKHAFHHPRLMLRQNYLEIEWEMLNEMITLNRPGSRLAMTDFRRPNAVLVPPFLTVATHGYSDIYDADFPRVECTMSFNLWINGVNVCTTSKIIETCLFDTLTKDDAGWAQLRPLTDWRRAAEMLNLSYNRGGGQQGEKYKVSLANELDGPEGLRLLREMQSKCFGEQGLALLGLAEIVINPSAYSDIPNVPDWLERLKACDQLAILLRAVLRTANEAQYNQCDVLMGLLQGSNEVRLFDGKSLTGWATSTTERIGKFGTHDAKNPQHSNHPGVIAEQRYNTLTTVIEALKQRRNNVWCSVGFDSAFQALLDMEKALSGEDVDRSMHLNWVDPGPVAATMREVSTCSSSE